MVNEEAVKAAHDAFWFSGEIGAMESMRIALETAAPHLRAEALRDAADDLESLPPKLHAQYVRHLRARAATETIKGNS